ncbi:MAG: 4Fe-4S binding protein [Clostridia bacterium]
MKRSCIPWILLIIFELIAVSLWLLLDQIFYFFNFTYIGLCLCVGLRLYERKIRFARRFVQLCIGSYMLIFLGLICGENMQIEGFWYYLFLGSFEAAVIHYFVAKICGPLVFGRGWCGYACWTAMILDLLPFSEPSGPRKKIGYIRYILFALSLLFVGALFVFRIPNPGKVMFWCFIFGNILYYVTGIALAFLFKDNRAFCKYICPVTVFLKPMSYFSLLRLKVDADKCVSCGKCVKSCPMDVDLLDPSRKRKNGTECILCFRCSEVCPKKAVK